MADKKAVVSACSRRLLGYLVQTVIPGVPLAAALVWLIIVTLPYYAFGFDRLPQHLLCSNNTDPVFYYERVVGVWLASLMLTIWAGFVFLVIPAASLSCMAVCVCLRRYKRWYVLSLICAVAMYMHLENPLWHNGDVIWATDIVYDMRCPEHGR